MIVLDASIVLELLISSTMADPLRNAMAGQADTFIVPHLIDVEVSSALRRLVAGRRIDAHRAAQLVDDLANLSARRLAHTPLLRRIWELRHNFTAYDAVYIALAEDLDAVLYTCDEKLTKGHRARVRLFTA